MKENRLTKLVERQRIDLVKARLKEQMVWAVSLQIRLAEQKQEDTKRLTHLLSNIERMK